MARSPAIPAWSGRVANPDGTITPEYRTFLIDMFNRMTSAAGWHQLVSNVAIPGWINPTGVGSQATFDMNWTTAVSGPPTQAQMTAMRDQVVALQKALGQLILNQKTLGLLS